MESLILKSGRSGRDAANGMRKPIVNRVDRDRLVPLLMGTATEASSRLRKLLGQAKIVEPPAIPGDVVTMRSRVVLRDPLDGELDEFCLRYPMDARDGEDDLETLLVTSPLGAAVLSARPGDTIVYHGAKTMRSLVVDALIFQPEQANLHDL